MRVERPEQWEELRTRLGVVDSEVEEWRVAAAEMYVGYDEGYGITKQDESFLAKEKWDFDAVGPDRHPLLLHFHPLVIYRYQVIKQADVVMAMFLLPEKFPPDLVRRNFYYYDPLTTGDSSLSACVQSIVAAQIGEHELAMQYFRTALFMDLADCTATPPTASTWRRRAGVDGDSRIRRHDRRRRRDLFDPASRRMGLGAIEGARGTTTGPDHSRLGFRRQASRTSRCGAVGHGHPEVAIPLT